MAVDKFIPHILGVCLFFFLVPPMIPTDVLRIAVGSYVGSFLLLALGLYVLRQNATLGLAVFLSITALFLENRRRIVNRIYKRATQQGQGSQEGGYPRSLDASPEVAADEVHPSHDEPSHDESKYESTEELGSNDASDMNGKAPINTVGSVTSSVSNFFQKAGLASID